MKKFIILVMCLGWLVIGTTAFAGTPNLKDVSTARNFLLSLPSECGKSYMSTLSDGTIMIQVICNGTNEGKIYIKDNVVTRID